MHVCSKDIQAQGNQDSYNNNVFCNGSVSCKLLLLPSPLSQVSEPLGQGTISPQQLIQTPTTLNGRSWAQTRLRTVITFLTLTAAPYFQNYSFLYGLYI